MTVKISATNAGKYIFDLGNCLVLDQELTVVVRLRMRDRKLQAGPGRCISPV
jgi:hypothetical protein